jgi:hypothetical protein
MEEKFTVAEFKKYIQSQKSSGSIFYFCTAENIRKANQKAENNDDDTKPSVDKCVYYGNDRCGCLERESFYCDGICHHYKEE